MKTELVAKNCTVNQKITDIIGKKTSKLDKYFDDALCRIYLKKESERACKMEIELTSGAIFLRARATAENFYDAVDLVVPKLEKQIYKYRSKFADKLKKDAFKDAAYGKEETMPSRLVKTKRFKLEPVGMEEAIEQLELLGHSFHVFLDRDDNRVKVLYLRDDGDIGLIDPET